MRRSRGGLTTQLHALVDAHGRPVGLRLTGGQVHDACEAGVLIKVIPAGATLLGDKGYDSDAIREAAAARGVWANIPNRSNRKQRFGFSPKPLPTTSLLSNLSVSAYDVMRNESTL